MRKIDWEKPLSKEDIAWVRQAGFMSEEQIQRHQDQFDAEVPEVETTEDTITQSALDPQARLRGTPVAVDSAPVNVTPSLNADAIEPDEEGDDYDQWKVAELKAEVEARNALAEQREDVTAVQIEGTGKDGAVTKSDVVKALRIWDDENPDALKD